MLDTSPSRGVAEEAGSMDAHQLTHAPGAGRHLLLPAADWSHRHVWYWLPVCYLAGLAFARRRYA
jgi:hypothetical protein